MSWIDAGRHLLRTLFAREQLSREMDDEMRFHMELDAMHERDVGQPEAAARKRFGHVGTVREERRRASGLSLLDRLQQDANHAVRQLRRAPAFTTAVALTFALGVGANATMFAIVDRVMLRAPAGIAQPERVRQLRSWRDGAEGKRDSSSSHSYASFVEFRAMTDVFEHVTAVRGPHDVPVGRGSEATNLRGSLVSGDYFRTLGAEPALGRFFHVDETLEPTGAPVAVISHALWTGRYGRDPAVIGQTLIASGTTYTIVGVTPSGFSGHTLARTDLWLPIAASPGLRWGGVDWAADRGTRWLQVIGRLRAGVSEAGAAARIATGWSAWNIRASNAGPKPNPYFTSLIPADQGNRPEYRVARLLSVVALLLLVITCANVANLLLARALARRREVAIRLALGVSRARLTALFVVDALLLALLGGAAAVAFAAAALPIVRSVLFAGGDVAAWSVDIRVVLFSIGIALIAGLAAAIVPAIHASRPQLLSALRGGTRDGTVHRSRARQLLLVAQGALTVALLAGTGLFVRSLQHIGNQQLGLDLQKVLVADFSGRTAGFAPEVTRELNMQLRARARTLPGVESASLTVGIPLEGQYALPVALPGLDSVPGFPRGRAPFLYAVTHDFLATMGTRIVSGRGLTEADEALNAPAVAVVNAEMARLIWPRGDAIGQCFKIVLRSPTPDCIRVVGIAEDARRASITADSWTAQYYIPLTQAPRPMTELTVVVRATEPRVVMPMLSSLAQSLHPDMPFVRVRTLEDAVALELRPWRLGAWMFALFGGLALLVAAVGTYSVIQFGVTQRQHELGVRLALGARRREILAMVMGEALRIGALAAVVGTLAVLAGGRLIATHLFQTSPRDPIVLTTVAVVLVVAALAATLAPAWRATRVDPLTSLRAD